MTTAYEQSDAQVRAASGLNVLAGLWLVISPWALGFATVESAVWNSVMLGLAVAIISMMRVAAPLRYEGLNWLNFVLGVWLILSPFLLNFGGLESAMWNTLITGLAVLILAAWSASATRSIIEGNRPRDGGA